MVSTVRHRKPTVEEEISEDVEEVEVTVDLRKVENSNNEAAPAQPEMLRRSSQNFLLRVIACLVLCGAGFLLVDRLTAHDRLSVVEQEAVPVVSYKQMVKNSDADAEGGRGLLPAAGNRGEKGDTEELEVDPGQMKNHFKEEPEEKHHERALRYHKIWRMADKMITEERLWPDGPQVDVIIQALKTARIVNVDVLDIGYYESGTSEKWLIMLEGGQKAVMKLVWEAKGQMKPGALCNYGFEMATSEVAGFNLQRVLKMENTPYVTGRKVDLMTEILPAATPAVARQIFFQPGESCVQGKCFHCDHYHLICPKDGLLEASLAYWIPRKLKLYTEGPRYMPYSTPTADEWGKYGFNDPTYCKALRPAFYPYENDRFYYDLFDFAVIDTLMYHYDSKHYMVHDESEAHGLTIRLDHGRSFCANDRDDEHVFMAPLFQCCTLRMKTWQVLRSLKPGDLTKKLKTLLDADPIAPVLEPAWFPAMERRLVKIKKTMEKCAGANGGFSHVLVDKQSEHTKH